MIRFAGLAGLAGCLGPPPREPTVVSPPPAPSERIVVGGDTEIAASWSDTCEKSRWTWHEGKDEHDAPGIGTPARETTYHACNEQRFQVVPHCSLKCELVVSPDDATYTGSASVRVRALEPGVLAISLEIINADTSEHRSKDKTVEVVLPDSFRTQCMTPSRSWGPCERGVSAEQPLIRIWPVLDRWLVRSALLRVNGVAPPPNSRLVEGVSLAAFLPAAQRGTGIAPGTYELTISVGAKEMKLALEAR